ncbi:tail fiber domain-containing protein [Flavobacterium phragmitis]|uniref:Chaperone of endosialidase n=1 Tax=Flavobacterium phragmitis TaxID=739143 RepID=A0A1I1T6Y7_9FLAO|nr:tail fiber domain-containing protein [Flavobacterium phragmitis]SFD54404.1 Chaperone of endosialidase [Flavobacterium phragmitis]
MNKYLIILLSLLFPCMLLAQNKGIRAVDNKGTIIYVDPSKWFEKESNLFNKNTNGNVAIGLDPENVPSLFNSRLYISNANSNGATPVLKLDTPFDGELTDDLLTWNPSDFSVRKIAISTLSTNDWHILGNAGTDPSNNFIGTTDDQPLIFKINNQQSGALTSVFSGANTSFGHYSLQNPDVAGGGRNNSAFGAGALILNSTGANNTAMGVTALQNNSTGGNNTAIGMNSMSNNIAGSDNTAMGALALFGSTAGSGNTTIGASAGYNVSGNYNTLIGLKSGLSITSGTNNTVIGGSSAGDISVSAANASHELNIGNALYGTGINNAAGANTGKIGINTNDPQAQLDVNGQARVRNLPAGTTTDKIVTADTDGNLRTLLPADLVPATINTLTATNGNLISTVNGVATTPAVPVLISANNGLTSTNGNVQLGGTLTLPATTITTDATHTLAISGLQTVTAPTTTDNLVTADPTSGVLHQRTVADAVGSIAWLTSGNLGTNPTTNFLGTKDDNALMFRVKNIKSGILSNNGPTAFGFQALLNSNGTNNTAFGYNTLTGMNSGTSNVAVGYFALRYNNGGNYNTAMGVNALGSNTTGNQNIAIGNDALKGISTSTGNIAIGYQAGANQTSGGSNIIIGNTIDAASLTGANQLNIGNTLFGTGMNGSIGGGKIGINTTPSVELDVNGQAKVSNLPTGAPTDKIVTADASGNLRTLLPADLVPATINSLTATNGNLISTVNGVATTPAVPVLISANNGLTSTNGNVQLGGTLTTPTTINTNSNSFAISNLPVGAPSDRLVAIDPSSGILKTVTQAMWSTTGNGGTNGGTNFLGTTDNNYLSFKVNNNIAGMIATNTKGNSNVSLGYQTINSYTGTTPYNGAENTAIGTLALNAGGTASDNTALGYGALYKGTSSANTAVGALALNNYTTSSPSVSAGWNTAVGYLAISGQSSNTVPVTGAYNNAMGASALHDNTSGSGNIAIGYNALSINSTGNYNVAIGHNVGSTGAMGTGTGNNNIIIGGVGGATPINVNPSAVNANNELNIGNTLFGININKAIGSGNIGINNRAPAYTLDVTGDINASGSVRASGLALTSDIRYKKNISTIQNPLSLINSLRGTQYEFKVNEFPDRKFSNEKQLGVIAQEVEKVLPELVTTDKDGYKAVNYIGLVPILIEGVKAQQTEIEDLKSEVETLKKQMQEIKDLLNK